MAPLHSMCSRDDRDKDDDVLCLLFQQNITSLNI